MTTHRAFTVVWRASLFIVNAGAQQTTVPPGQRFEPGIYSSSRQPTYVAYMIHLKKITCGHGSEDSLQLKKTLIHSMVKIYSNHLFAHLRLSGYICTKYMHACSNNPLAASVYPYTGKRIILKKKSWL